MSSPQRSALSARTRGRLAGVAGVALATAAWVALYAGVYGELTGQPPPAWELAASAGAGLLLGALVGAAELFLWQGSPGERLRRAPFALALGIRSGLALAVLVAALVLVNRVFYPGRYLTLGPDALLRDVVVCGAFLILLVFGLQVRRLVGPGILGRFLLGRYHRPVREERVFLFLDLADSTALTERLGDLGAHALVTRFFFDLAGPIREHGGETHRYIGDEVVVTWPLAEVAQDSLPLRCALALRARMASLAPAYQAEFGVVPAFRTALHAGPVVLGECGDDKLELVYFGDTINLTARIAQEAKALQRDLLFTNDLLRLLALPPGWQAIEVATRRLAGREEETALLSLEQAPALNRSAPGGRG